MSEKTDCYMNRLVSRAVKTSDEQLTWNDLKNAERLLRTMCNHANSMARTKILQILKITASELDTTSNLLVKHGIIEVKIQKGVTKPFIYSSVIDGVCE